MTGIGRRATRTGIVGSLTMALAVAVWAPAPVAVRAADSASPACTPRVNPVTQGPATLVSRSIVPNTSGRVDDVVLDSPALPGHSHVYILRPRNYDASGATRYPVLYLLHGAAGGYTDWITQGNAEQIIDDVSRQKGIPGFITVMPDSGTWGFYSDWYGTNLTDTSGAPAPAWTSYHINEVIPWVDAHYPTIAQRNSRAIAGLSMGGFGTMSYAARYPDLFAVAGSFSGAVDPDVNYPVGNAELTALSVGFTGGQVEICVWGDWQTQDAHWRGNNPTYLAENLAHTALYIASGGSDLTNPVPTDPIEEGVYMQSKSLVASLDSLGIAHTDNFYGAGTHAWSYWQTDLRNYLPFMAGALAHPPAAAPAVPFSYRSISPAFSVFDWSFSTDHQATEFTYLSGVSRTGLSVTGSGSLHVTTAALYAAGSRYLVTVGGSTRTVVADGSGRLSFPVDLGAAHTSEQTAFAAADTASWAHAALSIAPAPAAAAAAAASEPGLANTSRSIAAGATGLAIAAVLTIAGVARRWRRRDG